MLPPFGFRRALAALWWLMSLSQVLQVPFAPSRYGMAGGVLLQDLVGSSTQSSLGIVADDQFQIQLFPRLLGSVLGGLSSTQQLATGSSIVFSIKTVIGIGGATLLGEATGFTEYADGDDNWYYGSTLALDEEAVAAALGDSTNIPCIGEIRITDTTGSTKRYQFSITLFEAVYTGDEDSIAAPAPGTLLNFLGGSQSIASGATHVTVTGLGLSNPPALILPEVVKADGTKGNIDVWLRSGWTGDSFTVDLSGAAPDDTYLLTWIVAPSSGSVGSVAVAAEAESVTVPLALPRSPSFIRPVLVKTPSAGGMTAFLRAGWGPSGFTVDLSGAAPDDTYVLYYLLVP
jgi:hypothetical protein